MKLEKIEVVKAFLASWLDYWILQSVAFTVLMVQENATYGFARWALLSFYPFGLYLLRRKFPGFLEFVFSHLGVATVLCLIPAQSVMEKQLFCIYVAGYIVYSFYIRAHTAKWQDRAMPPLVAGGILTVLVFTLYYFKRSDLEVWFIVFCIVYLILYFIYSYMLEYIHFVKLNEGCAGYIPVKKMFIAGLKGILPYSMLCGVILFLVGNATLLVDIFMVLKRILLWILGFLFANLGENSAIEDVPNTGAFGQTSEGLQKLEGEAFWLWEMFEKIMAVALIVAAVYLVVKLYQLLVLSLKNMFSKSMQKSTEVKEELVDKREKCNVEKVRDTQNKKHALSIFSNKERIRKIYKRKIENARKTSGYRNFLKEDKTQNIYSLPSATARECCVNLSAESLADVYEKARYSNFECDATDVRVAKKWQ